MRYVFSLFLALCIIAPTTFVSATERKIQHNTISLQRALELQGIRGDKARFRSLRRPRRSYLSRAERRWRSENLSERRFSTNFRGYDLRSVRRQQRSTRLERPNLRETKTMIRRPRRF